MMTIVLDQEKVNELVDQFYDKLLKDPYYINMFNERNTDIELLKARQRVFINRLVSGESDQGQGKQVSQVKERHPFHIAPDRAEIWFGKLKETMDEMEMDVSVKKHLTEKVDFLLSKITK
ncbi:protoglobin domain-containing protein [Neobacillus sp. SuZ13]|uniref:protoglobin domain-containing protein n=1 Tax=Neobacillus sp. SuZ13 TaxID=3047875 RepID=UPI0024C0AB6D|nr:protoglobin domain-containing protein [Neobacillus sp. SuZ13]WHY64972.1 protoglobin domain-containing protein [Neobacillus sp. SuZ13]